MKIHYKIIKQFPEDSQIVVRYFTDIATEQYFSTEVDKHGEIIRSRADYLLNIPLASDLSIEEIIEKSCPRDLLAIEEKKIQTKAGSSEHKEIIDNVNKINKVAVGKVKTLEFEIEEITDESILQNRLKRIDAEFDSLIFSLYGSREAMYKTACVDALAFKSNGYVGEVPAYIKGYMKSDSSLTVETATDNIIKKSKETDTLAIDINTNRLIAKAGLREGKEKALNAWNKYFIKTKTKIGK